MSADESAGVAGDASIRERSSPGCPPCSDAAPERFDGARDRGRRSIRRRRLRSARPASRSEAIELLARTEALFLDPTYTAKAMAGLIARMRAGEFADDQTVLFWHTGGQVGLFA